MILASILLKSIGQSVKQNTQVSKVLPFEENILDLFAGFPILFCTRFIG